MGKPFWKSKTLAFNALTGILGAANELAPILDQLVAVGYAAEWVPQVRAWLFLVNMVGNSALRLVTDKPVTLK